jgi:hypothetical protein
MRSLVSTTLLVIGLLTTGLTAVVAYLTRTVLDEDAFSNRIVAALEEPDVSAYVAQRIADAAVAANRDLTGIRPVIATFAEAVVNTAPFHALVRRAAREAHQLAVSRGGQDVLLSVPDVGVLLRGTLQSVSPEIAQRIPRDVRTVIETQFTGAGATKIVAAMHAAGWVRMIARFGLITGLLVIILSVVIATERRQAVLNAGIGLLAVAAVLALVVPLGRVALTGAVGDPSLRGAVGGLWRTFAGGLLNWAIGLAAAALMVVTGVTALLDHLEMGDLARRGLSQFATRQSSRGREDGRVAALIVIGAFAIAAPLATLATMVVATGTMTLVWAVHGLVALVAPQRQAADRGAASLRLNPVLAIAVACVAVTAAGLGGAGLVLRLRTPDVVAAITGVAMQCNGAVALCDRRLDEITLAGAHNAMGSSDDPDWMFPNQDADVRRLLRLGVRAFMLDVWHGHVVEDRVKTDFASEEQRSKYEVAIGPEAFAAAMSVRDRLMGEAGPTGLYMCHGFCELGAVPFDTALAHLKAFLVAQPHEVVLLILEDHVPPAEVAAAFERQGLTPYLYDGPSKGPFPTLRHMIARNQRLFVTAENDTGDLPWYHPAFEALQETPYTFHAPEDFSCQPNRGDGANPLFLMNHWIETRPAPRPSNAELVNAEAALLERARLCQRERGKLPNIIAVDFAATGDVVRAAAVLNGIAAPGEALN